MIERALEPRLHAAMTDRHRKVVLLHGARQVGKTTLVRRLAGRLEGRVEVLNGDFLDDRRLLRPERAALARLAAGADHLVIDEAQGVPDIGLVLKLLHDEHPGLRVLATGSSSLDLASRSGEPLTGRQRVFVLHPVAWAEQQPRATTRSLIVEHSLVHGCYPEVITIEDPARKVEHLRRLVADSLLKDVFQLVGLDRGRLLDLLRLLALQLGSEVSLSELARAAGLDAKTVARYLDVLEDTFVIVQLRGFSRNLRKEISKARKVYFLDVGIRNAIVQAFQPSVDRPDLGGLWENWLVVERMKRNTNAGIDARYHFWRTYDQKEIDLVEERTDGLFAFEFKRGARRGRIPRLWRETYPESEVTVVTPDQVDEFLRPPDA